MNSPFFQSPGDEKNKHYGIDEDRFELQRKKREDYQGKTKENGGECASCIPAIGQLSGCFSGHNNHRGTHSCIPQQQ